MQGRERRREESSGWVDSAGGRDEVHEAGIQAGRLPIGREQHQVRPFSFFVLGLPFEIVSWFRSCDFSSAARSIFLWACLFIFLIGVLRWSLGCQPNSLGRRGRCNSPQHLETPKKTILSYSSLMLCLATTGIRSISPPRDFRRVWFLPVLYVLLLLDRSLWGFGGELIGSPPKREEVKG